MRSRIAARQSLYLVLLLTFLLLVNVVTEAVGRDESQVTVANFTGYYLHVFIEDATYLYVAPERSVSYTTDATPSLLVEVCYAPGQGVRGSLVDTVSVPYTSASAACSCEDDELFGDCIVDPESGGSARLEVRAEDMTTQE